MLRSLVGSEMCIRDRALSTAPQADIRASCFADDFPRVVAGPARVWGRGIGQLHRAPFDRHLPYQIENFVRLVLTLTFLSSLHSALWAVDRKHQGEY